MKRCSIYLCLAAVGLAVAPPAFADDVSPGPAIRNDVSFRVPPIREGRLSNGIKVSFVERHDVPLFSVQVVSTVSAADAPPGVAELAARSAVSSTYHSHWMRTYKKFNLIGAHLSSWASYASTGVSTHAMAPYLEDAVEELSELARVQFPDEDIVRQARDTAIDSIENWERSSATFAARAELYPVSHPYHYAPAGTVGAIRGVEANALRGYWKRAFSASNVVITASGDVSFERLMKALEHAFVDLEAGTTVTPSAPPTPPFEARKGVVLIHEAGTTQARVAVVAHGVARNHPDYLALSFAATILDGALRDRIRKAYGASYGVDASLEQERGTAPFWVYGSIENGSVGSSVQTILGAINDLRTGNITPQEFEHNRMLALNHTARWFETTTQTASILSGTYTLGLTMEELKQRPDRLRALKLEQITAVAKNLLADGRLRVVIAGDAKVLLPELDAAHLGPVEVRHYDAPKATSKVAAR